MELAQIRRSSDPLVVQQLYDAINSIRKQRQIANLKRILRIIERDYGYSKKDILHSLHKAVTDELIVETLTVGCKGVKTGVEQEGYWICDKEKLIDDMSREKNDWYCFNCHESGEVITCGSCFRVYHPNCVELDVCTLKNETWFCSYCVATTNKGEVNDVDRNALGRCLHCVVGQQKEIYSDLCSKPDEETGPYYEMFVHTHYDLDILYKDCENGIFSTVEEFESKINLIEHNFTVVFGRDHVLSKNATKFVEACKHELKELKLCENCFYLSNTKPMDDWFCKPCNPPHQVVWAKQKGFDFWPAKIIRVEDEKIDVRFFGRHHPRAWITVDGVKDIAVSPSELKVKRKQQWKQASNEMKEYIRQCECGLGKEEASKVVMFNSPYGIGKNVNLLKKLNFRQDENKSKKESQKDTSSLNIMQETLQESENIPILDDPIQQSTPQKRKSESIQENKDFTKKIKLKLNDDVNQVTSTNEENVLPKTIPSTESIPNACGCSKQYAVLFNDFKEYIIESAKLEEKRMMKNLQALFDDKVKVLEDKHRTEISQVKKKQWCFVCEVELKSPRLKSKYCSHECESNYSNKTDEVSSAKENTESKAIGVAIGRPKRLSKS